VLVDLSFFGTLPEDLNFQMGLARIRAGAIVPEPSTIVGILLVVALLSGARCRRGSMGRLIFVPRFPMRFALTGACAMAAIWVGFGACRADVVLDDFDQPFMLRLPQDISSGYNLQQSNIGPLNAQRQTRVGASTSPSGQVDSNLSIVSGLNFSVSRLNLVNGSGQGLTYVALDLQYVIGDADVSQGSQNDRLSIDFSYLYSALPLTRADVFIFDSTHPSLTYVSELYGTMPQDTPFSLQFPFSSFGDRGGGGASPLDSHHLNRVLISIYAADTSISPTVDQINFSAAIDKIRFTNAVPEPASTGMACLALLIVCSCSRKR
jgi:hypothetical protein